MPSYQIVLCCWVCPRGKQSMRGQRVQGGMEDDLITDVSHAESCSLLEQLPITIWVLQRVIPHQVHTISIICPLLFHTYMDLIWLWNGFDPVESQTPLRNVYWTARQQVNSVNFRCFSGPKYSVLGASNSLEICTSLSEFSIFKWGFPLGSPFGLRLFYERYKGWHGCQPCHPYNI